MTDVKRHDGRFGVDPWPSHKLRAFILPCEAAPEPRAR